MDVPDIKAAETEEELELLFDVPRADDLPSEITLFEFGMTETVKGPFLMDEMAADLIMRQFAEQGTDRLPFDVGHGMLKPNGPDDHRAYGWFIPAVVDLIEGGRGLVASDIQWTKAGAEALKNREFRFFSPGILFESESRRITKLINVALTNLPATKNQKPLVLDATEAEQPTTEEEENMQALLDATGAQDEASAVAKVIGLKADAVELQAILSAVDAGAPSEAVEAIEKLKSVAEAGIVAQAELSAIATERAAEKRSIAIEALDAAGKLQEGQKEFAALLSDDHFEIFSKSLKANPALTAPKVEAAELDATGDGRIDGADFSYESAIGVE